MPPINNKPGECVSSGSVIAYARYSSDDQNATSIDDQVMAIRPFAQARGLPAPDRSLKDEGVSVKHGMAPGFLQVLDEVRAGTVRPRISDRGEARA